MPETRPTVGSSERRVDAVKLATGRALFADDVDRPGLLHARVLRSPHAHARIRAIDVSQARAMPGVACVLTYAEVPRVLGDTLRFVGDRVALVAAEDAELALRACEAIKVEYDVLPAVLDLDAAGEPVAASASAEVGSVTAGFAEAEHVLEATYRVPRVAPSALEPHVALSWLDEDDRLVVRSASTAPFQVRRRLATLLDIPTRRVRVLAPRVGGAFGSKHDVLTEDVCSALTVATRRPVRLEHTREEELTVARPRAAQVITIKSGVKDGRFTALEMRVVADGGADTAHALELLRATGSHALSLYRCPNVRYEARAVHTNLPAVGLSGGGPQAFFALESHLDEIALALGEDPLELRKRSHVRDGDERLLAARLGSEMPTVVRGCGLGDALAAGAKAIGWTRKRKKLVADGPRRRGLGMALALQDAGRSTSGAALRMSEDGSFHLDLAATEVGHGSHTVLCQLAADTLGVPVEVIVLHASDTDTAPFDSGADPASIVSIAGAAVWEVAQSVLQQILAVASRLLEETPQRLTPRDGAIVAKGGRRVSYEQIGLATLAGESPRPIVAWAAHTSLDAQPSFAATFAEVEVDVETGLVSVLKLVEAVDCGRVVNPALAEAQVESGALQGMGSALYERLPCDATGRPQFRSLADATLAAAGDAPQLVALLVPGNDAAPAFGAKALGEVPLSGPAPAIANAVAHAVGIRVRELPLTPERVWAALQAR